MAAPIEAPMAAPFLSQPAAADPLRSQQAPFMSQPARSGVNFYTPPPFINTRVGPSQRKIPVIIKDGKKFVTLSTLRDMSK